MATPITPATNEAEVFLMRETIIWENANLKSLGDPTRSDPVRLVSVSVAGGTIINGIIDVCRLHQGEWDKRVSVGVHVTWNEWQPGSSRLIPASFKETKQNIHNDWRRWRTTWKEHFGEKEETRWREQVHTELVEEEYQSEEEYFIEKKRKSPARNKKSPKPNSSPKCRDDSMDELVEKIRQIRLVPKKRMVEKKTVTHHPYTVMVPHTWHTEESYQIPLSEYTDPEPLVDRYIFSYDLTRDVPLDNNVKRVWLQMAAYHRYQGGLEFPYEFWDSDFGKNHHMSVVLPSSYEVRLAKEMVPAFDMPTVKRSRERTGLNRRYNQMSKEASRYVRRLLEQDMSLHEIH
jgi:hypothetical protein